MSTSGEVTLRLKVRDDGSIELKRFKGELEATGRAGKRAGVQLSSGWRKVKDSLGSVKSAIFSVKGALAALVGAVGLYKLIGAMKEMASAAMEEQRQIAGLNQVLVSTGRYTPQLSRHLRDLASALELQSGRSNDAIIAGEKFLATYTTIGTKMLPEVTRVMVDLATLTGGDMVQAANLLGKASMGLTGELSRYGITLSDEAKKTKDFKLILRDIKTQVEGQAAAFRQTAAGAMAVFGQTLGDVKKQAGFLIVQGLQPLLNVASTLFNQWSGNLEQWRKSGTVITNLKMTILEFAISVVNGLSGIVDAVGVLRTAWNVVQNAFILAGKAIIWSMQKLLGVMIAVAKYIPGLGSRVKAMQKSYDLLGATLQGMNDDYRQNIKDMENAGKMGVALHKITDALKKSLQKTEQHLKDGVNPALQDWIRRAKMAMTPSRALAGAVKEVGKAAEGTGKKVKRLSDDPAWRAMQEKAKAMYQANLQAYKVAKESEVKLEIAAIEKEDKERKASLKRRVSLTQEALAEMRADDLAYWVGVVNNANTTEDKLREAWDHIRTIAQKNNIDAVTSFELGWRDATSQFKTTSMTWLEVGRNTAQTLQKDFSDYFFDAFEGKLKSFKDFWKKIWNDMKAIFLRAIAEMLSNSLVKGLAGIFGGGLKLNLGGGGGLTGALSLGGLAKSVGGMLSKIPGVGSLGKLLGGGLSKIPGVSSVLSKIPGVAGLLGLGGSAATATIGAGAGVTGAATLALGGGTTAAGASMAGLGSLASLGGILGIGAPIAAGLFGVSHLFGHHESWGHTVARYTQRYRSMDLFSLLDEISGTHLISSGFNMPAEKVAGGSYLWEISGVEALAEKLESLGGNYERVAEAAKNFSKVMNDQKIDYQADLASATNFSTALQDQINRLQGATGPAAALRERLEKLKTTVDMSAHSMRQNLANAINEVLHEDMRSWSRAAWNAFYSIGKGSGAAGSGIQALKNKLIELNKVDPKVDITIKTHVDRATQKYVSGRVNLGTIAVGSSKYYDAGGRVGTAWADFDMHGHHTGYNVPSWIPKHHSGFFPSTGEHLAVIRNDETVLTPEQMRFIESNLSRDTSVPPISIKIVTESGEVLFERFLSEFYERSEAGEAVVHLRGVVSTV